MHQVVLVKSSPSTWLKPRQPPNLISETANTWPNFHGYWNETISTITGLSLGSSMLCKCLRNTGNYLKLIWENTQTNQLLSVRNKVFIWETTFKQISRDSRDKVDLLGQWQRVKNICLQTEKKKVTTGLFN